MPSRVTEVQGPIAGWGRVAVEGTQLVGEDLHALTEGAVLSRGLGRSYGDSSLPVPGGLVANTTLANRIISFDPDTGLLRAEAGLSLTEMNRIFLPRGWFTPVTPGTSYVTLGGMVAADVHGKNHHSALSFGEHLAGLRMRVADGSIVDCSPQQHADLFDATIGGMGLTGHILEVAVRMKRIPSPWIHGESERVPNIHAYLERLHATESDWPMSVGWIDCVSRGANMGRGILNVGRWAEPHEAPAGMPSPKATIALPDLFPSWSVNPLTVRAFNFLYYWKHWQPRKVGIVHPASFFYPLDAVRHWNRIYGSAGMTQYQCVLPKEAGRDAPVKFLDLLSRLGGASFLCVIKDCADQGRGLLSFPMPGVTVAVDVKITARTPALVKELNAFVIDHGGRVYLAKDQFTTAEDFRKMEPRLDRFLAVRHKWDPDLRIRSAQSVRLFGDPPE